ncbi:hypothetical protein EVAR_46448_1 [Eumeta japonica]|uniref:EF-hand domain-containing protein n=1 Tax=Eumeta variegata TaxID=151549 RepID=A0A4C1XJX5_EUMVA|nr:hypothetical protein EVAR_46448_1 [Eumeta japonica]
MPTAGLTADDIFKTVDRDNKSTITKGVGRLASERQRTFMPETRLDRASWSLTKRSNPVRCGRGARHEPSHVGRSCARAYIYDADGSLSRGPTCSYAFFFIY